MDRLPDKTWYFEDGIPNSQVTMAWIWATELAYDADAEKSSDDRPAYGILNGPTNTMKVRLIIGE